MKRLFVLLLFVAVLVMFPVALPVMLLLTPFAILAAIWKAALK